MHHVVGAHVVDDRQCRSRCASSAPSPSCTVSAVSRPVQHRLPVKADEVGLAPCRGAAASEIRDGIGMPQRDVAFQRGKIARPLLALHDRLGGLERRLDAPAERGLVGHEQRRPALDGSRRRCSACATSMPSIDVPLIRPIARSERHFRRRPCDSLPPDAKRPRATRAIAPAAIRRSLGKRQCPPSSPISCASSSERGFIHQISDETGLDALVRQGDDDRLCRLRRDGDQPAHRQPDHRSRCCTGCRRPATGRSR